MFAQCPVNICRHSRRSEKRNRQIFKKIKGAKHADASVDATKPTPASSIFAVYKNYKSGATTATDSNGGVGNNSKKVILKDNVNKFIFKGRIDDYALDVKAREKKKIHLIKQKMNNNKKMVATVANNTMIQKKKSIFHIQNLKKGMSIKSREKQENKIVK